MDGPEGLSLNLLLSELGGPTKQVTATYVSHDYGGIALSAFSSALDEVDHSDAECRVGCARKSGMRKRKT